MIPLEDFKYNKGENLKKLIDTSTDSTTPEELKDAAEDAIKRFTEDLKRAEIVAIDTAVNELLAEIGITPPQNASPEEIERVRNSVADQSLELNIGDSDFSMQEKKQSRSIYLTSSVTNELIAERQIEITWGESKETQE